MTLTNTRYKEYIEAEMFYDNSYRVDIEALHNIERLRIAATYEQCRNYMIVCQRRGSTSELHRIELRLGYLLSTEPDAIPPRS